jgi:hypothetical protein
VPWRNYPTVSIFAPKPSIELGRLTLQESALTTYCRYNDAPNLQPIASIVDADILGAACAAHFAEFVLDGLSKLLIRKADLDTVSPRLPAPSTLVMPFHLGLVRS